MTASSASLRVLGRPGALPTIRAFPTNPARVANRVELRERMIDDADTIFIASRTAGQARSSGVPAGPINTIGQMFADPQMIARGMRLDLDDGHGNRLPSVRAPMVMSETPLVYERPSPRLGEHTEEILAELERGKMKTGGQLIVDALKPTAPTASFACRRILPGGARRAA